MSDLLPTMIPSQSKEQIINEEEHVNMVEREKVDTDEVFIKKDRKPVVLKVSDESVKDEESITSEVGNVEDIIKPVKKPKGKRIVTEAQKEHLAKAREKALETRRRNKVLREEEEEANQSLLNKKQLARKKIRDEENKKLDAFIGSSSEVNSPGRGPTNTNKSVSFQFTQADLDKAVMNGIEQYEHIRKARKVEKQKIKEAEKKQQQVYSTITKAVGAHDWSFAFQ